MRILYIHNEKRLKTGANYVNNFFVHELRRMGHWVDAIYPEESINLFSTSLKGISSILFYYSLITKKREIKRYDIIQGTTYTTLAFLEGGVPVISHFGSTTWGFLKSVPPNSLLDKEHRGLGKIFNNLKRQKGLNGNDPDRKHLKSLKDIGEIEFYVAKRSDAVVAASKNVEKELAANGVPEEKITVIHNGIEDFWFKNQFAKTVKPTADLVYLGRLGHDGFTMKLKGIPRLIAVLRKFPELRKKIIGLSMEPELFKNVFNKIPKTSVCFNLKRSVIPRVLKSHYGDIYLNAGRYEGFCLSLIESMSQGLVPIVFPIGVGPEIIKNGRNGFLVSNIKEAVNKIDFLSKRKTARAKMAEKAIETAKLFQSKEIIKQYINLYAKLRPPDIVDRLMNFLKVSRKPEEKIAD